MQIRLIAYYLPQYHPIAENDQWQGKGFTEWTNVTRSRPLFKGHYQPRLPSELGFYDLRVPETRIAQAELAREHGIFGFCYWHYWLGNGKRLLERPFNEVLRSKEPDFPFCLAWANHSWSDKWFGKFPYRTIVEQTYPGTKDYEAHFQCVLQAFSDERYITLEGKPIFVIFRPKEVPDLKKFSELWRELAHRAGLKGLYIIGNDLTLNEVIDFGLDGVTYSNHYLIAQHYVRNALLKYYHYFSRKFFSLPIRYSYKQASYYFLKNGLAPLHEYPSIIPCWDNTPRWGSQGLVLTGSTPELFSLHLSDAISRVIHKKKENRILFVKSWNEWAEGNYLEPDQKYGRAFLEVIKDKILYNLEL